MFEYEPPPVTCDVFFTCGYGSESISIGNTLFRELIAEFSESYKVSSSSREMENIAKIIILTVQYFVSLTNTVLTRTLRMISLVKYVVSLKLLYIHIRLRRWSFFERNLH